MENPFEIILEKLNSLEKAIEKNNASNSGENILLSADETCELLKIKRTTLYVQTKKGKLTCYGLGNRIYYKKDEVLKNLIKTN